MDYKGKICPYCKAEFKEGDEVVVCSVCEMPHHKECWIENKACTTFGCTGTIQNVGQDAEKRVNTVICPKCGHPAEEKHTFCVKCGTRISNFAAQNINNYNNTNYMYNASNTKKPKKNTALLVILIAFIAVAIVATGVFLVVSLANKRVHTTNTTVNNSATVDNYNFEPTLNAFLSENDLIPDVSVAIYDNKREKFYCSTNAYDQFVAWGVYIPIYLAYSNCTYIDNSVRNNILSSNAGVCNDNANAAMVQMGGLDAVNNWIADNFNTRLTYYGRAFGDTTSKNDNITCAYDAVNMLSYFNKNYNCENLSYKLNDFGIKPPSNTYVYAQAGTENNAVRKNMNLLAVVKGENTDYCIVILTRNSHSSQISSIWSYLHGCMESDSNE